MGHPANNCNFWRSNFSDVINNSVSGQGARCGTDLDMSRRNNSTNKSNNHSQGLDHHVKKGK